MGKSLNKRKEHGKTDETHDAKDVGMKKDDR